MTKRAQAGSYPSSVWRLIMDDSGRGAWNMAVDEAILSAVVAGDSLPTLRFYQWDPPCLSLGRSQPDAELDMQACRQAEITWVRRPTGGRAILHKNELTYSICLPLADPRCAGDVVESYRRLSDGLATGLSLLGIAVGRQEPYAGVSAMSAACFDAPAGHEITVGGRKLLGSAQFRTRHALLQHGSLPLFGDIMGIVDFLALPDGKRELLATRLRATATTLEQAAGRRVTAAEATQALTRGIARALNVTLRKGSISAAELCVARQLCADKYDHLDCATTQRKVWERPERETMP